MDKNLEDEMIHNFKNASLNKEAIGDDAAILPFQEDLLYVLTQDSLVENVHFRLPYYSPEDLAHKSLTVNMSDISAMGATPIYAWIALSFPHHHEQNIRLWQKTFSMLCAENNIAVMGGDTTSSKKHIFITITLMGTVSPKHLKPISTAKEKDVLILCGNLGWAKLGFLSLEKKRHEKEYQPYQNIFLRPKNRRKEGEWFGRKEYIHSLTDISDGLIIAIEKMMRASQKTAVIQKKNLTYTQEFEYLAQTLSCSVEETILFGAEDYGLLLSVEKNHVVKLLQEFKETFHEELTILGEVIPKTQKHVILMNEEKEEKTIGKPFLHFP